jgi:hypothetical protein
LLLVGLEKRVMRYRLAAPLGLKALYASGQAVSRRFPF